MDKITSRDGKWFLGDVEVDASAVLTSAQPAPVATEALAQAREEGAKGERSYRGMFNTVVGTAGLDAAGATEFEKQFYGRNETDLKFLASHAIGQRAKPLGEGNDKNSEGENDAKAKAEKKLVDDATGRFNAQPQLRRAFGLLGSVQASDPSYQDALKRYVASTQKQAKDEAALAAK